MANLKETSTWEAGIYQWETSDPVLGGENGIDNVPTRQLANRTVWLKNEIAARVAEIGTKKADKATTLAGYGIGDAFTKTEINNLLAAKVDKTVSIVTGAGLLGGGTLAQNRTVEVDFASVAESKAGTALNKSINPNTFASAAYAVANSRYDGSLTSGDANDFEIGTRYLCSSAILNTPNNNTWWDGTYSFIETKYSNGGGQKIQIAWGYERANLATRTFALNVWSAWKPVTGSDWTSTGVDGIRNKPTTVAGFGLTDVHTKSQMTPLNITDTTTNSVTATGHTHFVPNAAMGTRGLVALNDTVGAYSLTEAPTMTRHSRDTYKIPAVSSSLDDATSQPLALYSFTAADNVAGFSGFGYLRSTQYSTEAQMSQIMTPYTTAASPRMWSRHKYGGSWTVWGRIDGADFGATAGETGHIYNKPTTLDGYGITDAIGKVNGLGTNSLTITNSQYPAIRLEPTAGSYSMVMECSGTQGYIALRPRGSAGTAGNGQTFYNFQSRHSGNTSVSLDVATTDQLFAKSSLYMEDLNTIRTVGVYGQNTNANATNAPNYPYPEAGSLLVLPSSYGALQFYITMTGKMAMRNASSGTAWYPWRTYTTLSDYNITDAVTTNTAQAISGVKTFNDLTGFLSTKQVGYSTWQDTVRLNGTLPVISNGQMGIGYHKDQKIIYFMDIESQTYLSNFNFKDNTVTIYGKITSTLGFFKNGIETAYNNRKLTAGTGMSGGGTLAADCTFAIDKAATADITAGTVDKVVCADLLKPVLDLKANAATTFTAGTGLTGAGSLAANRTISIDKATAANVTAGTANKVVTTDILKPALDAATAAAVTSVRLGAEVTVKQESTGTYKMPAGNVMTGYDVGLSSGSRAIAGHYSRPVQAQINGVWVTVAVL